MIRAAEAIVFSFPMAWGAAVGGLPGINPAPEFTLTKDDKPLELEELRGKALAIIFIFASCTDTCPLLTVKLAGLQSRLAAAFDPPGFFVSITLGAERDTPEVLTRYAKAYNANPAGWAFLMGTPGEFRDLARPCGIYYKNHPTRTLITHF